MTDDKKEGTRLEPPKEPVRDDGPSLLDSSIRSVKLLVLSDLHLEMEPWLAPCKANYDLVVLAGDIHSPGIHGVEWAKRLDVFEGKPVVYVPGNHEFYHHHFDEQFDRMAWAAEGSNVHVLDRTSVNIAGVKFLGCILWTDFRLPVRGPWGALHADVASSLRAANSGLNDFALIRYGAPVPVPDGSTVQRKFQSTDSLALHWMDRDWLEREINASAEPVVVVTHHAPSAASIARKYAANRLSPAFASELPAELFQKPKLWVHGHTHSAADYWKGNCRVVSNPRGYRRSWGFENPQFDPEMVVEVACA